MQFLILAAEDESAFEAREHPERSAAYWSSWSGYLAALTEAGVLQGAGGLQPPWTATTLRVRDGRRLVQDGPYAETKEQLGGYFVVEVPDLDTALAWAERCPSAEYASVEVRPLVPPPRGCEPRGAGRVGRPHRGGGRPHVVRAPGRLPRLGHGRPGRRRGRAGRRPRGGAADLARARRPLPARVVAGHRRPPQPHRRRATTGHRVARAARDRAGDGGAPGAGPPPRARCRTTGCG
nr:YciI family protein [Nocardioides aequoreus]